jgi:hypothetical protein
MDRGIALSIILWSVFINQIYYHSLHIVSEIDILQFIADSEIGLVDRATRAKLNFGWDKGSLCFNSYFGKIFASFELSCLSKRYFIHNCD